MANESFAFPSSWQDFVSGIDPKALSLLEERERAVEDYLSNQRPAAVFSYPSAVASGASGRWYPGRSTLTRVLISRTAGTTALTVTLYKNGVSIGTVTTSADGATASVSFGVAFAEEDYLTVNATTPGTGTTDVVVQAGFS